MSSKPSIFRTERQGDTLILIPQGDLGEFHFEDIEREAAGVLAELQPPEVRHVIVDWQASEYCGSSALAFLLKIWKRIRDRHGQMVLCDGGPGIRDVLTVTKLDTIWPTCATREEALRQVHAGAS